MMIFSSISPLKANRYASKASLSTRSPAAALIGDVEEQSLLKAGVVLQSNSVSVLFACCFPRFESGLLAGRAFVGGTSPPLAESPPRLEKSNAISFCLQNSSDNGGFSSISPAPGEVKLKKS